MKKSMSLPYRQVHLDFHTGPWIYDVGRDFDAREFARTMKKAHVDSVTVFAKCHHGHLYYDTRRAERHPCLRPGLNLLAEQVDALHREGIRAPIYLSVQCDEYAANRHPEWVARQVDSSQVRFSKSVFEPAWQVLDMSSPYQEYLCEQTDEVLRLFHPVDGIFFDLCWDQPSTTQWAIDGMLCKGLDPEIAADRDRYARIVSLAYMKRLHAKVRASSPNASVYFNCRPIFNLAEDIRYLGQVEIEALPTGGWGYMYFPRNVRYARTFSRPYMGMTARFHKSWADFGGLKPYAALEYETSQMMAHGARCSIGDQMHPRGVLDAAAYELIGRAYARVEEREPWIENARPVVQIGVFQAPSGVLHTTQSTSGTDEGVTRMLTQLRHQFDIVGEETDLDRYELLILPDAIPVGDALARRLQKFIRNGGALLATGTSGLSGDATKVLLPELPVRTSGMSPYTATYIRFGEKIADGVPATDHVMYNRGVRVEPLRGAQTLAGVVEPYYERAWNHFCSHNQTPTDSLSRYAAAVRKGNVAYISYPVFSAFAQHGNYPYRLLVRNILNLLLPEPVVRIDAPTGTEVSVMRQRKRTIAHVLHYCPERRAANLDIVEDVVPLHNVTMSVRLSSRPRTVYLAPERQPLEFDYSRGRASVCIPQVNGHAMVVME